MHRLHAPLLLALSVSAAAQGTIPFVPRTTGPLEESPVASFLGASGLGTAAPSSLATDMGLGWIRLDVSWLHKNPAPGVYDWTAFEDTDQLVGDLAALGYRVVLMVRNTPDWAATTVPYSFDTRGRNNIPQGERWEVTPTVDPVTGFANGYALEMYSLANGALVDQSTSSSPARLRVRDPQDFATFMTALVAHYGAAPYGVRHFQIGNEHTPESGHYPLDDTGSVAARWFVPGAQAVHAADPDACVMNCWPNTVSTAQLDAFDAVPGALGELDIFVQHYGGPERWDQIQSRYAAVGRPLIPIWATEFGSVTNSVQPDKIAHDYPALLRRALERGLEDDVDRFKVFWWPYGSNGPLTNTRSLARPQANELTSHGEQVRALHSLLHGRSLDLDTTCTASPDPGVTDHLVCFRTDRGRVVSIGLDGWTGGSTLDLTFPDLALGRVSLARTVDGSGAILGTLAAVDDGAGGTRITVDLTPTAANARAVYVELHASPGETYCAATTNSSGSAATVTGAGPARVDRGGFELTAGPCPPHQFGLWFYGPDPLQHPLGNGTLCIGGSLVRLPVVEIDGGGFNHQAVDETTAPTAEDLVTGSTWHFQFWFRDPTAAPAASNLSAGYRVRFE